jgi:orotate phosphoribosyltransferase
MNTNLIAIIKKYGLKYGDFTLASGARSTFYLDVKAVSLNYQGLWEILKGITQVILDNNYKFDAIGGPTIGADPIVGGFLMYAGADRGFLVRSTEKGHGLAGRLVGEIKPGESVLLVEDVVTSGGSLLDAVNFMTGYGCPVVAAIAVLDRGKDTAAKFNCPFHSLATLNELGLE